MYYFSGESAVSNVTITSSIKDKYNIEAVMHIITLIYFMGILFHGFEVKRANETLFCKALENFPYERSEFYPDYKFPKYYNTENFSGKIVPVQVVEVNCKEDLYKNNENSPGDQSIDRINK